MGQRGKQSAQIVALPKQQKQRIKPPTGGDAEFKKIWRSIVGEWPGDYFNAGDKPLLVEYVNNLQRLEELAEILKRDGLEAIDESGGRPHWAIKSTIDLQRIVLSQAIKLRISPSCRDNQRKNGTTRKEPEAIKRWS